jgi:hypothetical protein
MTRKQLESIVAFLRVSRGEIKLREASNGLVDGPVTVGSFYRTVGQARNNFREALVTVLIGLWVDAIRLEDVRRLFELVGVGSKELSDQDQERFLQVLNVLLDRMVV